jgi:hypothetical protein
VGAESGYVVALSTDARGTSDRSTRYLTVARVAGGTQSYTPSLSPGETVYVGVSADGGLTWSEAEAVVSAPSPEPEPEPEQEPVVNPPAPVLATKGQTISWAAIPGVTRYELATVLNPTTTRETTYTVVTGTSFTPPALPGETVNYGLRADAPIEGPWAQEVTISYPSGSTGNGTAGEPAPPPPPTGKIIGTNDGAGWGSAAAQTILGSHHLEPRGNRLGIQHTLNVAEARFPRARDRWQRRRRNTAQPDRPRELGLDRRLTAALESRHRDRRGG